MEKIKFLGLGGFNENGKNMLVIEIDDDIFIIEAGIKYPESKNLGVKYLIPDMSYVIENKHRVKGIFVTHAHNDLYLALPYLLKEVDAPVYTGALSGAIFKELLEKENIKHNIKVLEKSQRLEINKREILTFGLTHSFPNNFGIAIKTQHGYIVYLGEHVIDYDINYPEFSCDINELSTIGKKGVFALFTESVYADKTGHTTPKHRIADFLEPLLIDAEHRVVIAAHTQSLFRIIEILETCRFFNKKVYFHDQNVLKMLELMEQFNYYRFDKKLIVQEKDYKDELDDIVVLVSEDGRKLYQNMQLIAVKEDSKIQFRQTDTIIMCAPTIAGAEADVSSMMNEIYKEGNIVHAINSKTVLSMHPSSEDLKMMIYLFKPKYYVPMKGEYRHLIRNAEIGYAMGIDDENIIILDNGQVAYFEDGVLIDTDTILEIEETKIDGFDAWEDGGVVLRDRELLSSEGVIILGVGIDIKTKEVLYGPDIQTRGLVYLKEAKESIDKAGEMMLEIIKTAVAEKTYDHFETRGIIKDKIGKFLFKEIGKKPMVLPVIMELHHKNG